MKLFIQLSDLFKRFFSEDSIDSSKSEHCVPGLLLIHGNIGGKFNIDSISMPDRFSKIPTSNSILDVDFIVNESGLYDLDSPNSLIEKLLTQCLSPVPFQINERENELEVLLNRRHFHAYLWKSKNYLTIVCPHHPLFQKNRFSQFYTYFIFDISFIDEADNSILLEDLDGSDLWISNRYRIRLDQTKQTEGELVIESSKNVLHSLLRRNNYCRGQEEMEEEWNKRILLHIVDDIQ